MRLISHQPLRKFWRKHPQAERPLQAWAGLIASGSFSNFAELKHTFGSVDKAGELYVFDIGGNKYRVVCAVHFNRHMVFVRAVMTHAEYDAGKWKE